MTGMLWYVATPYSKYPEGLDAAAADAAKAAGGLMRQGLAVFCPIAHAHHISIHGGIDPLDYRIWLPLDEHMMEAAAGLIIVHMEGWRDSYGVKHEWAFFDRQQKPVRHVAWPSLAECAP